MLKKLKYLIIYKLKYKKYFENCIKFPSAKKTFYVL